MGKSKETPRRREFVRPRLDKHPDWTLRARTAGLGGGHGGNHWPGRGHGFGQGFSGGAHGFGGAEGGS